MLTPTLLFLLFPSIWSLVPADNYPPEGWVGNGSQIVEIGEEVAFCAYAYDEEDDEVTYHWNIAGQREEEGEELILTFDSPGVYVISMTAIDSNGATDETPYSRYVVVVDPASYDISYQPVASITTPADGFTFPLDTTVLFQGFGSDEDNDALTFYWDFDDGFLEQGQSINKRYEETCLEEDEQLCHYYVQCIVVDAHGLVAEFDVRVSPYEGSPPPDGKILSPLLAVDPAQPYEQPYTQIKAGESVELEGALKDGGNLSGYSAEWLYYSSQAAHRLQGFHPPPLAFEDFPEPGMYEIEFWVTSPQGVRDPIPDIALVWVRDSNSAPEDVEIVEPNWDEWIELSEGIDLAAYAYDDDEDPIIFDWTITEIGGEGSDCQMGERIDHYQFPHAGLYQVSVVATDSENASVSAPINRYIVVSPDFVEDMNYPPDVRITDPTEQGLARPPNTTLTFKADATDEEGDAISQYYWDFGNNTFATTANPNAVSYTNPGYYLVRAYAQDALGNWSFYPAEREVYIYSSNIPPSGKITQPALADVSDDFDKRLINVPAGAILAFKGEGSDADGNLPLSFTWELWFEEEDLAREVFHEECTPDITFDDVGYYYLDFSVEDSKQASDPFGDYRVIRVVDLDQKPEINLYEPAGEALTVEPGEELYFFAYAEDPNDLEVRYEWDFGPGQIPSGSMEEEVYPVIFNEETAAGQPHMVSVRAIAYFTWQGVEYTIPSEQSATIQVTVKRYADSDFEPNNNPAEAKVIEQGSYSSLNLDASQGDSSDYFLFKVEDQARDVSFRLGGQAGALLLNLYRLPEGADPNNTDAWEQIEAGTLETGSGSFVLEKVPPGTYLIVMSLTEVGKRAGGIQYSLAVSELEPSLFLPFLVEDGNFSSTIGLINTTGSPADLVILGLDAQGKTVLSKSMQLPPNGRFFKTGLAFFGATNDLDNARLISWVKVLSTQRLVGYTNAESNDKSQLMSMGAMNSLSASVVVPHIAKKTEEWYTRSIMVNDGEKNHPVDFVSKQGDVKSISEGMAEGQQVDFRFKEIFPEELPEWGRIQSKRNIASLTGFEVFGRRDSLKMVAGLEMVNTIDKKVGFTQTRGDIYFSHIAKKNVFYTGLSLINVDKIEATYNLVAYDEAGVELVRKDGEKLAVGGKELWTRKSLFGEMEPAWIKVETENIMAGFELFGDNEGKNLAAFKAARSLSDTLYFPHLQTEADTTYTGIALLNVGDSEKVLTIIGYNDVGSQIASTTLPLGPRQKLVTLAQQIFTDPQPVGLSYICVRTDQAVLNGFEIFGTLSKDGFGEQLAGLPALRN